MDSIKRLHFFAHEHCIASLSLPKHLPLAPFPCLMFSFPFWSPRLRHHCSSSLISFTVLVFHVVVFSLVVNQMIKRNCNFVAMCEKQKQNDYGDRQLTASCGK
jgi:hypothetical protein